MKKLNQLFDTDLSTEIYCIEDDSKKKQPHSLFVCIQGLIKDGHDYAKEAIKNGAVAILASKQIDVSVPVLLVEDTNQAMIHLLNTFYDRILERIKLIGVTGTDGKTTLTNIIYQLINKFKRAGYIGTNGVLCNDFHYKTGFTTPFPIELFDILNRFYQARVEYVAMEVSSERLLTRRMDAVPFDIAILTNITSDHLDKHQTFDNYLECKGKLFEMVPSSGYSIINVDDDQASYFIHKSKGKVITYGINKEADVMAKELCVKPNYLAFTLDSIYGHYKVCSPLSGYYNVYNVMAAITTMYLLGFPIKKTIDYVNQLQPIVGRAIISAIHDFHVIIDYAHTANALKQLINYAKLYATNRIITVTGAAGGRDCGKRPIIGSMVASLSDYVIFTMDDPRNEDVIDIIHDLTSYLDEHVHHYEIEVDRKKAIQKALKMAKKGDVVVVAGRGDDRYMPIRDHYIECNDYEEVALYEKQVS